MVKVRIGQVVMGGRGEVFRQSSLASLDCFLLREIGICLQFGLRLQLFWETLERHAEA